MARGARRHSAEAGESCSKQPRGQLAPRLEPADPSALVPGARVVVDDGGGGGGGSVVEGEVLEADGGDGVVLVGDDAGGERQVPAERLRLRYDACFRVLAPCGGLLAGEVV